jgi:hypothetical protein
LESTLTDMSRRSTGMDASKAIMSLCKPWGIGLPVADHNLPASVDTYTARQMDWNVGLS